MNANKTAGQNREWETSLDLASVRRLEAASFRGFPSSLQQYDGTWAVRLTPGHPARRINSVNPLDIRDGENVENRLRAARELFDGHGRQLVIRQTPLTPATLARFMDDAGWRVLDETLVMVAALDTIVLDQAVDRLPLKDVARWVDSYLGLSGEPESRGPGMAEIIESIQAKVGLFVIETADHRAVSAVRCVCDGDLAGIFELETLREARRSGHGRAIMASALKWAAANGARNAWLQVVADNVPAIALYRTLGFAPVYAYCYRIGA